MVSKGVTTCPKIISLLLAAAGCAIYSTRAHADESSKTNRALWSLSGGAALGTLLLTAQGGAELDYFLSPDEALSLSLRAAAVLDATVVPVATSLSLRSYFGNSFFTTIGGSFLSDGGANGTTSSGFGLTGSIGNRWHWQHFYIGGTWIGITGARLYGTLAHAYSGTASGASWGVYPVLPTLDLGFGF